MTAEQATTFEHQSSDHANYLRQICNDCEPYKNWFTYRRWQAQNFQVQKGQHGTHLKTFVEKEVKDKNDKIKTETKPVTAVVFCRHQVKIK